jgi:hypothetical protein
MCGRQKHNRALMPLKYVKNRGIGILKTVEKNKQRKQHAKSTKLK